MKRLMTSDPHHQPILIFNRDLHRNLFGICICNYNIIISIFSLLGIGSYRAGSALAILGPLLVWVLKDPGLRSSLVTTCVQGLLST